MLRDDHLRKLTDDLAAAGPRFSFSTEGPLPGLWLCADGKPRMQLDFFPLHGSEELANLLDQVQDVVMETLAEMWPPCPMHDHILDPRPGDDRVEWCCPETGQAVARFGELGSA